MATLYIHIGTHKTGTSTIQNTLNRNAKEHALEKKELYPLNITAELISLMKLEKEDDELISKITQAYNTSINHAMTIGIDKYVISFEGLSGNPDIGYANSEIIASSLKKITDNLTAINQVKIIVYLRRQDDFIESLYNQVIKQGGSETFEEFIETFNETSFNWHIFLQSYEKYFNKKNLIVRRYDKKYLPTSTSITEDFYKILQIKEFKQEALSSNKGLSLDGMEIARTVNSHLPTQAHKNIMRQLLEITSYKEVFEKYSLFHTKEKREDFLSKYSFSNNSVAKEYFNEKELFDDSVEEYIYEHKENLSNETILIALMKIIIQQNGAIANISAQLAQKQQK